MNDAEIIQILLRAIAEGSGDRAGCNDYDDKNFERLNEIVAAVKLGQYESKDLASAVARMVAYGDTP